MTTYSVEDIDRELSRRRDEVDRLGRTQETLENERDEPKARLQEIDRSLGRATAYDAINLRQEKLALENRVTMLTKHINRNIEAIAQHNCAIRKLTSYKEALQLVARGLSPDLIRR